jgi:xanthine dehydrogenase accessory factor
MEMLGRINELLDHEEPFCLATILTSNHPKIRPGRQAVIRLPGSIEGETGDSGIDRLLLRNALDCFKQNRKASIEVEPGMLVFFDLLARSIHLVICGAGHIAVPLARYACDVGFNVTVIDDREDFASPGRFPGCRTIAADFVSVLRTMRFGLSTYVVVVTRGHEHDTDCLSEVLKHENGYVGLIGSRRRIGFVLETLAMQGIPRDRLSNVFTPIGLPIGADSPEEIAVSIVAELVCVRKKGPEPARTLRESVEI